MATLIIDFSQIEPALRIKGLSYKAIDGTVIEKNIYIDPDDRQFRIDTTYGADENGKSKIDPRTAKISKNYLLSILKGLKERVPFDNIKTKGIYSLSGEALMSILNNTNQ